MRKVITDMIWEQLEHTLSLKGCHRMLVDGAENFIADKAYDSDEIRNKAIEQVMNPVISRLANSTKVNPDSVQ